MSQRYAIKLTTPAHADLDDIFLYVSRELSAPNAAAKLIDDIISAVHLLRDNPLLAPVSRDNKLASEGYRTLFVRNYVVFYVVNEKAKEVVIHRVLYGRRSLRWVMDTELK